MEFTKQRLVYLANPLPAAAGKGLRGHACRILLEDDHWSALQMKNSLTGFPASLSEEWTEVLAENSQTRIERIVSQGHASPPGFWYDQDQHEWVMLLQGEATLRLEGEDQLIVLQTGDHLIIPAHKRHRVESTSIECPTIWLAVFYNQD